MIVMGNLDEPKRSPRNSVFIACDCVAYCKGRLQLDVFAEIPGPQVTIGNPPFYQTTLIFPTSNLSTKLVSQVELVPAKKIGNGHRFFARRLNATNRNDSIAGGNPK
jgi:hypothetical protein